MNRLTNLDDVKALRDNDKNKMFDALWSLPEQCEEALAIGHRSAVPADFAYINNIVVTGLGGSAIGGDFLRLLVSEKIAVPVIVNRDYTLPKFINEKTLLFAVSYSGNTEETISAYRQAKEQGARVIALTNGGKLKELAEKDGTPVIIVPAGVSPRAATGYLLIPVLAVLEKLELLNNLTTDFNEMLGLIKDLREKLAPESPEEVNLAKQLARRILDRIPVIWAASGNTEVVSTRWKGQINENGKAPAYWNIFPELNHNEIVGFEEPQELLKKLEIIILRDKYDHPRVQKRMEITKEIIKEKVSGINEVWSSGESKLARLFSLTYIGDYVSVYLASMYGIDPTPVKNIDYLKNKLAEN